MPLYDPGATRLWTVVLVIPTVIPAIMLAASSTVSDTPTSQSKQNQHVSLPQTAKKTLFPLLIQWNSIKVNRKV